MCCAFADLKRVGCSDHYLNKILETTFTDTKNLELEEVRNLFCSVQGIVEYVRRAHRQNKLSKKLQVFSKTRFSGAYHMFHVFNDIFEEIPQALNGNHLLSYSLINKNLLDQLCSFLAHFDEVIEKLSDEQRPTIHLVVPLRQYLLQCCISHEDDEDGLIRVKKFIGICLRLSVHPTRIGYIFHIRIHYKKDYFCLENRILTKWIPQDEHLLGTILHPQLKHFDKNPSDKSRAMQLLQNEIEKRAKTSHPSSSSSNASSCTSSAIPLSTSSQQDKPTESKKKNILSYCLDDPRSPQSFTDEFATWMSSTLTGNDGEIDHVLQFWSHNGKSFPIISSIVRDIFAIPASNTMVERVFSISKNTVTDKRTRLAMDKIDKLMFLRKNLNILRSLFDTDVNADENNSEKRKNDRTPNESPEKNVKKSKGDENDIILVHQDENLV